MKFLMYAEIKRVLFYEMSRDDLKRFIGTLSGTKDDVDPLADFLISLREELSNDAPWKVSSVMLRLEKMDDYEELIKSIVELIEQYGREISSELGRFPKF